MDVTTTRPAPWGTVALMVANVGVFAFVGAAPDYAGATLESDREIPSIGRLLFDVLRHPDASVLAGTLLALLACAPAVERAVTATGLLAMYLVAGFIAGFAEVISRSGDVAVAGAFGGTTALLVMWTVTRWREKRDLPLALVVVATWVASMVVLRADGIPLLGMGLALWLGLQGVGAIGNGRRARQP